MIALLLFVASQSTETVPKAHKEPYLKALSSCRQAIGILESEPEHALELLDKVLSNPKIRKRECLLRIELAPGTYSSRKEFFPYQVRGRVYMRLAEKGNPERNLESAIRDLKESVSRGIGASREILQKAEARLEELRKEPPPETGNEEAFRKEWQALIESGRFAAAERHIESGSEILPDEERVDLISETRRRCRDFQEAATERFLVSLSRVRRPKDLTDLKPEEFDLLYALPDPGELVETTPSYGWCSALKPTLRKLGDGEEKLDVLLKHAIDSISLADEGENRWFLAVESLAFEIVRNGIERRATKAKDARAEDREILLLGAQTLGQQWRTFARRVRSAGRDRKGFPGTVPDRDVKALIGLFPRDAEGLSELVEALDACFDAKDPERAFLEIERSLTKHAEAWDRLTLESRRKIVTVMVIAASLRGSLEGKTAEAIAASLQGWKERAREVGILPEADRYGPKVAGVLSLLR
jgi:hypothetical protein